MANVMIWDPYERFIWGIAIALTLICGAYFIHIGRKRKTFKEKMILFGLASLPLGFAASFIIIFIQVIQIQGIFNNTDNIFYGDLNNFTSIYIILEIVSNAILGLTGMFFVLTFEVILKRTKYIFTIIFSILVVMVIFLPLVSKDPLGTARFIYSILIIPVLVIFIPYICTNTFYSINGAFPRPISIIFSQEGFFEYWLNNLSQCLLNYSIFHCRHS